MQDIAELAVEGLVLLDTVMGLFSRRTPMQVRALLSLSLSLSIYILAAREPSYMSGDSSSAVQRKTSLVHAHANTHITQ